MGITLTVYFEDPYWVGLFERVDEGGYAVARVVYGAEPSPVEVYERLRDYRSLRFSRAGDAAPAERRPRSPKRAQREAARAVDRGPGTRAQRAVQAMREERSEARRTSRREQRREEEERRFRDRVARKKERHRGH
jgi:hypothetical protein